MSENVNKIENEEINVSEESVANENIVKIADEVIMSIASATLLQIPGVHSMSGNLASGIVEFLGVKKSGTKGIKVFTDDAGDISLEIHVTVRYGFKIPDVAWEIQEKVKAEVESITGLNVIKVNVHVDSINIEKAEAATAEETEEAKEVSEEE